MGADYITCDLDLRARFNPTILDRELQQARLFGEFQKRRVYWRSIYSCQECVNCPSAALRHLLTIVEGLSPEARNEWKQCASRRFDLGFEGQYERFWSAWQVNPKLLRRIAEVQGQLVITIYRANPRDS